MNKPPDNQTNQRLRTGDRHLPSSLGRELLVKDVMTKDVISYLSTRMS